MPSHLRDSFTDRTAEAALRTGSQYHDVGCATQSGSRYGTLNQVRTC